MCWYALPKPKVQNLDPRKELAILVVYAKMCKAYKDLDAQTKRIIITKGAKFGERQTIGGVKTEGNVVNDLANIGRFLSLGFDYQDES